MIFKIQSIDQERLGIRQRTRGGTWISLRGGNKRDLMMGGVDRIGQEWDDKVGMGGEEEVEGGNAGIDS